ncbi:MAG: type II toxin-antitoxin system prevent-host-death family antitoxin [Micromonosporaceae bacterium]|nr:type II toxin-antitoxin system prevent-host-death family antitoxin [Micromonosporaceae bacterium]
MTTVTVTDAKARLTELLAEVQTTRDRVHITRNGLPAGVLLSEDEFESLMETLNVLSDPVAMAGLAEAKAAAAAGDLHAAEDVLAEMRARVADE